METGVGLGVARSDVMTDRYGKQANRLAGLSLVVGGILVLVLGLLVIPAPGP
jgi:hypothetical protein